MPRPKTKEDLLLAAKENYEKLQTLISKMSDQVLNTPFDFSLDEKKKEAHWRRDKNLRDVLIHLYEWHRRVPAADAGELMQGFLTLFRKELMRFCKVGLQTIAAPMLSALLYLLIFSHALCVNDVYEQHPFSGKR